MKIEGTIKQVQLAGGTWLLVTSEGRRFQIDGEADVLVELKVEGLLVSVEGELAKDRLSIGMTAPILRVTSWQRR